MRSRAAAVVLLTLAACTPSECVLPVCHGSGEVVTMNAPAGDLCNGFMDQCSGLGRCVDCVNGGGCGECCACSGGACTPA